jgi:hypothetical protein
MKPSSSNAGINKLARVMQQRMKEVGASPLLLDFGVIQDDYSLLTNSYPMPIPKADYMVCRQLTHGEAGSLLTVSATDGSHDVYSDPYPEPGYSHIGIGADHKHNVLIPEKMRWLKPGDRVLVAWVQNDAVVIDIVLPATKIGG